MDFIIISYFQAAVGNEAAIDSCVCRIDLFEPAAGERAANVRHGKNYSSFNWISSVSDRSRGPNGHEHVQRRLIGYLLRKKK